MAYSYFCPCPRGLETALAEELAEIATQSSTLKVHNTVPGGVHCSGLLADAMRLNLHSRIASRVLLRIAHGSYVNENQIYDLALDAKWEDWFGIEHTIRVDVNAIKSPLKSLEFTTLKIKVGSETVSLKVPAGIQDGQKLKVAGKGQASPNGGPKGDLVVSIKVKTHPVFTRDGDNVRVTVPVTIAEAILGATISVPLLGEAPVKLKVAPGTPNGRALRVKGKGVQRPGKEGDLLATVEIAVPSHVNDKAKALIEQFDQELPDEDPRADLIQRAGQL